MRQLCKCSEIKENADFLLYFTHLFVPLHTNLDHVYDGLQVFGRFLHPDDPISFVWDNGWEGEFSLLH